MWSFFRIGGIVKLWMSGSVEWSAAVSVVFLFLRVNSAAAAVLAFICNEEPN